MRKIIIIFVVLDATNHTAIAQISQGVLDSALARKGNNPINLNGTWKGKLVSKRITAITYDFYLQLHQNKRAVWGVYTTAQNSKKGDSCMCTITGRLSKKYNNPIIFYKDKVVKYKYDYNSCNYINSFQTFYKTRKDGEYLTGEWYNDNSVSFVVKKIDSATYINVDKYFPKLDAMIKSFNK